MLFDARAALARIQAVDPAVKTQAEPDPHAKRANRAKQDREGADYLAHLARLAPLGLSERENASLPGGAVVPLLQGPKTPSALGNMVRLDWSGQWVSRDRWSALSDFERHGPQGRLFCGKCWRWQARDTAIACLDGRPCR